MPAFLELELDKVAEVRKTLVAFLDDVIKQFPQCAHLSQQQQHRVAFTHTFLFCF